MNSPQAAPVPALQNRRQVLGLLAAGAALVGSTTPAHAFFFRRREAEKQAKLDLTGLPGEWIARETELKGYADFLASLKLRNITPRMVIEAHAKRRGNVWNTLPPKRMWRNIAPTLRAIDLVSTEVGQPVKELISIYRSPAYNARCFGARRGSWHQTNVAVDVSFPVAASVIAQAARDLRSKGHFSGGIGRYGSFTHIDTRGQNIDW
ncbi:MAG: D-Ala-D-Ala carboxypeptidase family metallohydrolase [Akkermansiaceae bacterium]|jgi:hypothetical protein|nr:D-Ala-D-Ala carboxypeptidase family metallohydrolase [Akkermansiaceae bacterium]